MTTQPRRSGVGWHALALASLLVGTFLRAWQIDIQILIDDEWHAIHKLLASTPLDIVTHLGYADYSIPLTLYYQSLYRTIGRSRNSSAAEKIRGRASPERHSKYCVLTRSTPRP